MHCGPRCGLIRPFGQDKSYIFNAALVGSKTRSRFLPTPLSQTRVSVRGARDAVLAAQRAVLEGFWHQSRTICGFEGVARLSEIASWKTCFGQGGSLQRHRKSVRPEALNVKIHRLAYEVQHFVSRFANRNTAREVGNMRSPALRASFNNDHVSHRGVPRLLRPAFFGIAFSPVALDSTTPAL